MTYLKGRRKLIEIYWLASDIADMQPSRYERAQTRGCFDLRFVGPNSKVRIIKPAEREK